MPYTPIYTIWALKKIARNSKISSDKDRVQVLEAAKDAIAYLGAEMLPDDGYYLLTALEHGNGKNTPGHLNIQVFDCFGYYFGGIHFAVHGPLVPTIRRFKSGKRNGPFAEKWGKRNFREQKKKKKYHFLGKHSLKTNYSTEFEDQTGPFAQKWGKKDLHDRKKKKT